MKGGKPPTVVMISTDYIYTYQSIYIFIIEVFTDIHNKKKHLSYNPILKGKSGPKLKAEISFISEYQMQAPLEFYFSFNLKFYKYYLVQ
jgi:hypothetical protein